MNYDEQLRQLIASALAEDIGPGDYSTLSCIDKDAVGIAVLKIKEPCVIAGMEVARRILSFVQESIEFTAIASDGDTVLPGDIAFTVKARIHTLLSSERLLLNCMQRMSGIATLTRKYVDKLNGYKSKLLDTRKTTPNFRLLEKEAVRIGGGVNHRFGLYDMIMLKDNHVDYAGGIEAAIDKAWEYNNRHGLNLGIEIEARNLADVKTIMNIGKVDRIMLDNFTPAQIVEALVLIDGKYETEASGGITLDTIESYAATGVTYISTGATIHQARSIDLSFKAKLV